jgi:TrmH family RNA methyltransferase
MTRRPAITSTANDRLKDVRRLGRRRRRGERTFLVEGYRQLRSALEADAVVLEVYAAPELFLGAGDRELLELAERRGARVFELGPAAFASISGQVRADGLAAVVERWPTDLARLSLGAEPLVLVAEGVERPGNLGTIVRSACAAGVDALIVAGFATDPFHPEAVRGSVGTLFRLPLAEARSEAALAWLRERAFRLVVTSPAGDRLHWEAELGGAVAVVVGGERHGVSRVWLDAAEEVVRIPMPGPADSLNVAVAAGIVLFEAARRRR